MEILVHTCCAPCLLIPLKDLNEQGHRVSAFYYNPNIHPYSEWDRRLNTLREFAQSAKTDLVIPEGIGHMEEWFRAVANNEEKRCNICYTLRLNQTAKTAKEMGFEAFSTTLLYSKFQKHELIKEVAEAISQEHSVEFVYRDWRTGWNRGVKAYKKLGLYRQIYCGCVYSERERIIIINERKKKSQ